MSGPDGLEVSADGNTLFVGNGDSSVAVFDLTTMNLGTGPSTPPTILATIPTGVGADYDGPQGISGCIASWNGEAGSATDCGDDRADEMSFDNVHKVLAVINGDPGLPFITFIDMSGVWREKRSGHAQRQHCLPIDHDPGLWPLSAGIQPGNLSSSRVRHRRAALHSVGSQCTAVRLTPQVAFLGKSITTASEARPQELGSPILLRWTRSGATFPCPDPSNPHVFSGVSGSAADAVGTVGYPGFGTTPSGTPYTIPCHHGPILDQGTGAFCSQTAPVYRHRCAGAIAPAGLGGMVWDPNTGHLLLTNENSVGNINIGSVDVIDPRLTDTTCGGVSCGPVVVNSIVMPNCMPTGVTNGPGNNFLDRLRRP